MQLAVASETKLELSTQKVETARQVTVKAHKITGYLKKGGV